MDLADKIRKIETLIAGAKSDGELQAAKFAKRRLQEKMSSELIEYAIRLNSPWQKRLFVAICNKHGLRTYRYRRQKHTTAMIRVAKPFLDFVLWPEFNKYSVILDELTEEILIDLISQIHEIEEEEIVISGELPVAEDATTL